MSRDHQAEYDQDQVQKYGGSSGDYTAVDGGDGREYIVTRDEAVQSEPAPAAPPPEQLEPAFDYGAAEPDNYGYQAPPESYTEPAVDFSAPDEFGYDEPTVGPYDESEIRDLVRDELGLLPSGAFEAQEQWLQQQADSREAGDALTALAAQRDLAENLPSHIAQYGLNRDGEVAQQAAGLLAPAVAVHADRLATEAIAQAMAEGASREEAGNLVTSLFPSLIGMATDIAREEKGMESIRQQIAAHYGLDRLR